MDERVQALRGTIGALEAAAQARELIRALPKEERGRLLKAMSLILHPDVQELRRQTRQERRERKAQRRERDRARRAETGIRKLRSKDVFTTPNQGEPPAYEPIELDGKLDGELDGENAPRELIEPEACYVCKQEFTEVHHFYDQMCPGCAAYNWQKRHQTADLTGRTAVLTGGRVKIGYQAGIKLLRAGAELIVTTRFPRDSAHALRGRAGFCRVERTGSHDPSGSTCATPRAWRPFASHLLANHPQASRLHCQQRLPDRAPAAPSSTAHMMERRDRRRRTSLPDRGVQRSPRRVRGPARLQPAAGRGTGGDLVAGRRVGGGGPDPRGAELSQVPLLLGRGLANAGRTFSRKGASTRISSRSTFASGIRGAFFSPRSPRSSFSRRNW